MATLWCWGNNASGQLGAGAAVQNTPVQVGSAAWSTVAAGAGSTCGVHPDGTLWCWGGNALGQLGVGDTTNRAAPAQVGTATGWTAVAPGRDQTCGLRGTGVIWCWGSGAAQQLGNGDPATRTDPKEIVGQTGWAKLTGGGRHACAIKSTGKLYCWGDADHGELGIEPKSRTAYFAPRTGAGPFTTLVPGSTFFCASKADSTLWCLGQNLRGQLSTGDYAHRYAFTQAAGPPSGTWANLSAGWDHICGVSTTHNAYCWGRDPNGRGGTGTVRSSATANVTAPAAVLGGAVWSRLAASAYSTCGIRTDTTLWCWGGAGNGALGDGVVYSSSGAQPTPQPVTAAGTGTWRAVAGGDYFHCGLQTDDSLWCWGNNAAGQLGANLDPAVAANVSRTTPQAVGAGYQSLSAGYEHACAITLTGALYCWGQNTSGEIGQGAVTPAYWYVPQPVTAGGTNNDWAQVITGLSFTCGRKIDNRVFCWGTNGNNETGSAAASPVLTPALVSGILPSSIGTALHASTVFALF
ncbi:hypothetical protein [Actinoplanes sp. L3-i22]|uniref:RCC1 domain-containing protein n=1 Tax=Actinoplanes sp. L3-i22 TaxID=2836373 RepID=UPI001C742F7D|nr:hypothetical protein [Actinoplanes sp. L3-i22]BCY06802.1 hypothetical protein L3i22_018900 [Actinoplanes sp. L3-i22]